jgi:hypothetical protein
MIRMCDGENRLKAEARMVTCPEGKESEAGMGSDLNKLKNSDES